jgi:TolB-like protein
LPTYQHWVAEVPKRIGNFPKFTRSGYHAGMARSLTFGSFRLDLDTETLSGEGGRIALGSRSGALLRVLLEARGAVVAKSVLMDAAWPGLVVEESNLTVQVAALRRTLGDQCIATVSRRGYRFTGAVAESNAPEPTDTNATVAVLPVSNVGGSLPEQYFGDGVTREVITALSRFAGLAVIAANSSFRFRGDSPDVDRVRRELGVRYVAIIGVQRAGERVRVTAQLIDTGRRSLRWAEHYDRLAQDIFAVQDEVADQIAAVMVAHVARAERERIARKPVEALQAYDYYLRALDQSRMWDSSDASSAEAMLQKAIELAPAFAAAHAILSSYLVSSWLEPKDARWGTPATLERAWIAAGKAVQHDPYLPAAHAALGWVQLWKHQLDEAVSSYRRAQELNPSFADGHYGHVLCIAGLAEEGLKALLRARLLDPFHPSMLLGWLGHCHLMLGQPKQALVVLRECAMRAPGWRPGHVWRAAACAQLGLHDEAHTAAASVIDIDPRFTVAAWQHMHGYRDVRRASIVTRSLVRAGLPSDTLAP